MTGLAPTFALSAGDLRSRTDAPDGGPTRVVVDRDMDVACDAVHIDVAERAGATPGERLEVALGHDAEVFPVFAGKVAAVRPALTGTVIHGVGTMDALLHLRVAATYQDRAVGDIVQDLLSRAGVQAGPVDRGPTLPRYVVQPGRSAFAHLRGLADRLGAELYADRGGRVRFQAPPAAPTGAIELAYGEHLLDAAGHLPDELPTGVGVGGESPMSARGEDTSHWLARDELAAGSAGAPDAARPIVLDAVARTTDLAGRFADGRLAVASRARRRVHLTVLGRPELDLGDPVAVTGTPDETLEVSGYVRALRHVLSVDRGFVTELTVATGGSS